MKIREVINHGSYRNVRDVTLSTPTWEAFRDEVLASGPYASTLALDGNRFARAAWDGVRDGHRGEFGWRTFTALPAVSMYISANVSIPEPALTYVVTVEFTDADGWWRHETDGANWSEAMYWIATEADRAGLNVADRHEREWTLLRDGRPVGSATVQSSNDRS